MTLDTRVPDFATPDLTRNGTGYVESSADTFDTLDLTVPTASAGASDLSTRMRAGLVSPDEAWAELQAIPGYFDSIAEAEAQEDPED